MSSQLGFSRFDFDPRHVPPVTKVLTIALLVVSLVASVTQRTYGFGVANLQFRVDALFGLELWRVITYVFVESSPLALIISLLVLWLFGRYIETSWGSRDFLRFYLVSAIGAALLAVPFGMLVDLVLPFRDVGVAEGPGAVFDALLVAIALQNPDSRILFGFALPIKARTLVLLMLGFHLITGIQTGAASLGITLGGMTMGYLLTTGIWRPSRWLDHLRLARLRRKRRDLYVVKPRKHDHTWN